MKSDAAQHFGGLNIGILVSEGFEMAHLAEPRKALEEVGAMVKILSSRPGTVQGLGRQVDSEPLVVDLSFSKARADEFDALLLPGGVASADAIGRDPDAQRLVRNVDKEGKPIGAMGHGVGLLVHAGLAAGRALSSMPELEAAVVQAGGKCRDEDLVVDANWVSTRRHDQLAAFVADFKQVLGRRVKDSVAGTPDGLPGAAAMGG